MAAWRNSLSSTEELDMCSSCFCSTKYTCLKCEMSICNKCSIFEANEDTPGWVAGKRVGFCEPCAKDRKAECNTSHAYAEKRKSEDKLNDDADCPDKEKPNATGKGAIIIQEEEIPESDEEEDKIPMKARKNAGRKSPWSQHQLDDFVDIIVGNEEYQKKLIFRNTKFQRNGELYGKIKLELEQRCAARGESVSFSVDQLRSKFKKCVSECKRVALTIKTATGIKRFLEDKGYGAWFEKLFEIVKTRDSCQPDQALEPSTLEFVRNEGESSSGTDKLLESESESNKPGKLFVPVKERKRSRKDDPVCEALKLMRSVVENDPTKEVINFLKEDIQKAREHELKLFQMMLSHGNWQEHPQSYSVPSNDFQHSTDGNQHSYQEFPPQQQYFGY